MLKLLSLGLIIVLGFSVNNVYGDTAKQVNLQDIQPRELDLSEFIEVGRAEFSYLFWDVYQSQLFTKTGRIPNKKTSEDLVLNITYLRNIESKDLVKSTVEQWQHLKVPEKTYQKYVSTLQELWPDIKPNDSLTLYVSKDKSTFYFNNQFLGNVDGTEFGKLFSDIWLSENTSEPDLRKQLLGLAD